MRVRFDEQLERLNVMLIEMGAFCEEAITCAAKAFETGDEQMRKQTIAVDLQIDEAEREIETLCLKLLLQQQPVATDLRVISSALKMISDMERIGDQARDIAEITKTVRKLDENFAKDNINSMTSIAIQMVTKSVDSFVKKDLELAKAVMKMDDDVDNLFITVQQDVVDAIAEDRSCGEYVVDIIMIAKYLERIGDHAVNIAEWVAFSITGDHIDA